MDKFEIVKLIHEVEKTETKTNFFISKRFFSGNILICGYANTKKGVLRHLLL